MEKMVIYHGRIRQTSPTKQIKVCHYWILLNGLSSSQCNWVVCHPQWKITNETNQGYAKIRNLFDLSLPRTRMTIVLIGISALFWGGWPSKIEVIIGALGKWKCATKTHQGSSLFVFCSMDSSFWGKGQPRKLLQISATWIWISHRHSSRIPSFRKPFTGTSVEGMRKQQQNNPEMTWKPWNDLSGENDRILKFMAYCQ